MRAKKLLTDAVVGFSSTFSMIFAACFGYSLWGPIGAVGGFLLGGLAAQGELERAHKEGFDDSGTSWVAWAFGAAAGAKIGVVACQISFQMDQIHQYQQDAAGPPYEQTTPTAGAVPVLKRGMTIQDAARQLGLKPPSGEKSLATSRSFAICPASP